MATIITRAGKGSPLTNTEVDNNFTNINTELGQKESASNKGVANGYASLDGSGKVPSTQLPSYVDDVVEGANLAALPATGETGKIYVTLDTNKTYRWSGSAYVEISASPGSTDAVTEGSTNLYFTNARARSAISATGSLSYNSSTGVMSFTDAVTSVAGKTGAVTLTNSDVGLGNAENKSSATIRGELTSGNVTTALGFTPANSTSLANYLSLSGGTLSGSNSPSSPILAINVSGSGAFQRGVRMLNSGMSAGDSLMYAVGNADGARNMGQFYFYFAGAGSTSNRISMGLHSVDDVFNIFGSGNIMVGTTSDSGHKFNVSGTMNSTGALTQGGNQVLHAGNYNDYAPKKDGTGASGTWGINITGNTSGATLPQYYGTGYNWNGTAVQHYWTRIANVTGADGWAFVLVTTKQDVNYVPAGAYLLSIARFNNSSFSVKVDAINSHDTNLLVRIDNSGGVWVKANVEWNSQKAWRVIASLGENVMYGSFNSETLSTPANSIELSPGQQVRGTQGAATSASVATSQNRFGSIDAIGTIAASGAITQGGNQVLHAGNYGSGYFKTINGSSIIGTGDLTVSDSTKLPLTGGNVSGSINLTNRLTGILVNSSSQSSDGGSIAIQQVTAEGWTGIFTDYEPYTGWGLWHDNPNNYFCFTAESSTNGLRSFTVPSRVSGNRTAYEKVRIDQGSGDVRVGGSVYITTSGHLALHAGNSSDYQSRSIKAVRTSNVNFNSLNTAVDTFTAGTNYIPNGGAYNQPADGDHHYLSWGGIEGANVWGAQIDINFYDDRMWFRRQSGSDWQPWRNVLHDSNYGSYALPLSGGNLTGQTTLSAGHGNTRFQLRYVHDADVNSGGSGYLTMWASEPGISYAYTGIGANVNVGGQYYGRQSTGQTYGVYIRWDTASGQTQFWNTTGSPGTIGGQGTLRAYVASDGELYATTNAHKVLNAGNYNDYAPSKTGTGANGTWNISISGNAATAGGRSIGFGAGEIPYLGGTKNLVITNPETYSGEVRLGAAWGRGGLYGSNNVTVSTSGSVIDHVHSDIVTMRHLYDSESSRLVVGRNMLSTPYTLIDGNQRPGVYVRGSYPFLTLDGTATGNGSHGPTIQFTHDGLGQRQWVVGTNGTGTRIDFGYADSGTGNSNYNPHNGISGYGGTTWMTVRNNGRIGFGWEGDWGDYGTTGEPLYPFHFIGSHQNSHTYLFRNATNASNGCGAIFVNTHGNHSWGIVSEFRIEGAGDRPSILFSSGQHTETWSVGYGSNSDNNFRIRYDHGLRNGGWGTTALEIDRGKRTYIHQGALYQSGDWVNAFQSTPTSSRTFHGDVSSGGPTGTWWFYDSMRHSNGSNYWGTQIAYGWEDNANNIYQRNVTGNSWSGWVRYLNSNNYSSYALPLGGGTVTGQATFSKTDDHAISVGTIRGRAVGSRTGEYIHLYERVHIGSPNGWGAVDAPANGLSTYGSIHVSTSNGTGNGIILADDGDIVDLNDAYCSMRFSYGVRVFSANRGGSAVHTLHSNGNFTASGNVTAYSDETLKKDWAEIQGGYVEKLANLKCGTYTRIDSGFRQAGVSAQGMREILQEVVGEDDKGILSLAYGNAAMVSAVELAKELVMLKKELAEIKSRLN